MDEKNTHISSVVARRAYRSWRVTKNEMSFYSDETTKQGVLQDDWNIMSMRCLGAMFRFI